LEIIDFTKRRIEAQRMQEGKTQQMLPVVTPIAVEVASDLIPFVENAGKGHKFLAEMIPMMRDGLFYELGVRFPGIRVRENKTDMPAGSYLIMINEVPLVMGSVNVDKVLVNDTTERLQILEIEGESAINPANGKECTWVDAEHKELVEAAGLTTWDAAGYMTLHLASVLTKNAAKFVGIQEVDNMLEKLGGAFPALVKETVPKVMDLADLTDILRRLLEEEISIRDLRTILDTLALVGKHEKDPAKLTECVRRTLGEYITHKYQVKNQNSLRVLMLSEQLEKMFSAAITKDYAGTHLAFPPDKTQAILAAVKTKLKEVENKPYRQPVILTTSKIRRYVRKLVESHHPDLAVVSYQELPSDINIQPLGRIE
jgi:type III secretion protein V